LRDVSDVQKPIFKIPEKKAKHNLFEFAVTRTYDLRAVVKNASTV